MRPSRITCVVDISWTADKEKKVDNYGIAKSITAAKMCMKIYALTKTQDSIDILTVVLLKEVLRAKGRNLTARNEC